MITSCSGPSKLIQLRPQNYPKSVQFPGIWNSWPVWPALWPPLERFGRSSGVWPASSVGSGRSAWQPGGNDGSAPGRAALRAAYGPPLRRHSRLAVRLRSLHPLRIWPNASRSGQIFPAPSAAWPNRPRTLQSPGICQILGSFAVGAGSVWPDLREFGQILASSSVQAWIWSDLAKRRITSQNRNMNKNTTEIKLKSIY